MLINESQAEFSDSALFLYFKGRVQRLKVKMLPCSPSRRKVDEFKQEIIVILVKHSFGTGGI